MADFSTVVTNQPKFFCETHPTRQKLFYISSYVKLVKIILTSLNQDPNMDFVPYAISLLPIPTSSIISVVQLIQAKKNREITTGKTWQHLKITSNWTKLNQMQNEKDQCHRFKFETFIVRIAPKTFAKAIQCVP